MQIRPRDESDKGVDDHHQIGQGAVRWAATRHTRLAKVADCSDLQSVDATGDGVKSGEVV